MSSFLDPTAGSGINMTTKTVATSIPDAGVPHLMEHCQQHQQRCHCANGGCGCSGSSKRRRSILKAEVAAASTDAAAGEPQPGANRRPPVRVEICEHRNKLIFYRQDKGWKVGYFSQHLHRRRSQAADRAAAADSIRAVQDDVSSGSSPDCSPSGSPPANPSCLTNPGRRPPLLTHGDLEISVKVIHACINGCFAINS